jgi:DNA-binding response OmpR family regulator
VSVVLLIDDEPAMGSLVGQWLADLGARVVQVETFEQAVAAARQERFRAVLLDIALDGADGLDMLPSLKSERSLAGAPVIAFSIHDSRRGEAISKGAVGFVTKPFRAEDLHDALREHLA